MRLIIALVFLLILGDYHQSKSTSSKVDVVSGSAEIPDIEFGMDEVLFNKSNSLWILKSDSSEVSGYISKHYADGLLAVKFGVAAGKREGSLMAYFPDGKLKFQETYRNNRLHGRVKRWTLQNGHQLIVQLNYLDGRLNGEQRKWYSTGELHKLMNMRKGKEDGMQQAFRKNGALYANYEAKNGRTFGMKRSNLCYELDNEKIVYKQ